MVSRVPAEYVLIPASVLEGFAAATLAAIGVPGHEAVVVSRCLLEADLRGTESHGIARLPDYVKRVLAGAVSPSTTITMVSERLSTAVLDAGNGWGQVAGEEAMRLAVSKARRAGVGAVGVRNNNHIGAAAYYVLMAVQEGMIGFATSNTSPTMAPWGGRSAMFGTNPIAVGIPAGEEMPVVLDMATSAVARGKIILAARKGERIPEGWALDRDGQPTTDAPAALAGVLLPAGGPKGSGLAMAADILSGLLTGALSGPAIPMMYGEPPVAQGLGSFFAAIDVGAFVDQGEFRARMDDLIRKVRACPPAKGFERVHLPGELELLEAARRRESGVPVSPAVMAGLRGLADRHGARLAW